MKVLKEVTTTGTIDHRDAYFKASLCKQDLMIALIFAVTIRNPLDETHDFIKVRNVLNGRIKKRFIRGVHNSKAGKLTSCIVLPPDTRQLCSKQAMEAMLIQFKRVKEKDLANELGLKWNVPEPIIADSPIIRSSFPGTTNELE